VGGDFRVEMSRYSAGYFSARGQHLSDG
jgi:hypothetical protein